MMLAPTRWWPQRRMRGAAGAALLLLGAIGYGTLAVPSQARRDALTERARIDLAAPGSGSNGRSDIESGLRKFWQTLPTTAAVPQWLERIRRAAVTSGLTLRAVDYRLERSADSPLLRYHITLPVTGSYVQVRSFVGAVLSDVPALAVDDVQFKRAESGSQLDARIRLTLFIAAGGPE